MEVEASQAPPRPPVHLSNLTRHPWVIGPLVEMRRSKKADGLVPHVINKEVIRVGAMHDKVNPDGWRMDVDGDLWHQYFTSDHLGPTLKGLLERGEISVAGYVA